MKKLFLFICLSISFLNLNCALGIDKEINTSKLSEQDQVNIVLGIYCYVLSQECAFDKEDKERKKLLSSAYKSAFNAIEDDNVRGKIRLNLTASNLEILIKFAKQIYNEIDGKLRAEKFGDANMSLCVFFKPDAVPES